MYTLNKYGNRAFLRRRSSAIAICFTLSAFVYTGCKKFVDVPPPVTQLVSTSVYSSDATTSAAISGLYETMVTGAAGGGGTNGISAFLGLSADEFDMYPNSTIAYNEAYTNSLTAINAPTLWSSLYNQIYQCNAAIEGLTSSSGVSDSLKKQFTGEAEFTRAFCYFYLVNIFGDVPLITGTDYKTNALASRSPADTVYGKIVADLKDAQSLLTDNFRDLKGQPTTARTLPNKGAATALMARVYLYRQQWTEAAAAATSVINNSAYQLATDLNTVFLANNTEAIWQLEPPNTGVNAADATFLYGYLYGTSYLSYAPFLLSDSLVSSFSSGDLRRQDWIVSSQDGATVYYFPYKYKLYYTGAPPTEYATVLRLAEQYLIRAEARAQQQDITGALSDLNVIRHRAGLADTSLSAQQAVLDAIYKERRLELFTEYGSRWLDLKRTGNIDAVMSVVTPLKGGHWDADVDKLYPIPLTEIQADPNLTQNNGY